jgi:hypothetical protein
MKRESGMLTIEASIALTAFMFLVLFILNFGNVYRAQSLVSHATNQTSQALAIESYFRETFFDSRLGNSLFVADVLGFDQSGISDLYISLENPRADLKNIIKTHFAYSIADSVESADKLLRDKGVVNGLAGVDFSMSKVKDSNIIVSAKYKVKLQFSFFGYKEIPFSKAVKTKAFLL